MYVLFVNLYHYLSKINNQLIKISFYVFNIIISKLLKLRCISFK